VLGQRLGCALVALVVVVVAAAAVLVVLPTGAAVVAVAAVVAAAVAAVLVVVAGTTAGRGGGVPPAAATRPPGRRRGGADADILRQLRPHGRVLVARAAGGGSGARSVVLLGVRGRRRLGARRPAARRRRGCRCCRLVAPKVRRPARDRVGAVDGTNVVQPGAVVQRAREALGHGAGGRGGPGSTTANDAAGASNPGVSRARESV
jgi:hypothetical protein